MSPCIHYFHSGFNNGQNQTFHHFTSDYHLLRRVLLSARSWTLWCRMLGRMARRLFFFFCELGRSGGEEEGTAGEE